MAKERVEADQAAHRRTSDCRGMPIPARSIARIDPALDRVFEEPEIPLAAPAAVAGIRKRAVFPESRRPRIVDADDDWLDARVRERLERSAEPPRVAAKGRCRVAQVLPVL